MKLKNCLIATLALLACCNVQVPSENVSTSNIVEGNFKNASNDVTFTYTFPTDWQTKLLTMSSWGGTDVKWVAGDTSWVKGSIATRIDFYNSSVTLGKEWNSQYTSYMFDTVYYMDYEIDNIMCTVSPSSAAYNNVRRISFWATDSRTVIVPSSFPYFVGTNATKFVFDNFKFSSKSQYDTVMTGSKATDVSGDDVSFLKDYDNLTDWKTALDTITGTSEFYKTVTSIKFESDSSTLTGYTDTSYKVGGASVYRKGTDIIFYSSSTLTAPTSMASLFSGCTSLKSISFNNLNTASTTDFSKMLGGCTALENADLSGLELSSSSLTQDKVTDMLASDTTITSLTAPNTINAGLSIALPSTYYDQTTKTDVTGLTSDNISHSLVIHSPHSSFLTKHDAIASTCEKQGNSEYYQCSVCGKYFSDSAATQEIDSIPYLAKLEHDIEETVTLSSDKKSATLVLTCKNDGKTLGTVNSTSVSDPVVTEPTCDTKGTSSYTIKYTFEGKDYTITYNEDIEPKGHDYKFVTKLSDDKSTATIDVSCENEGTQVKETINATSVTSSIKKAATHFETGIKVYTVTYSYGGKTYTEEIEEVIPVLADELTYECILGQDETSGQIKVTKEDGTSTLVDATVTSKVETQPTCTQVGKKVYTFTGTYENHTITQTLEQDIPLVDHDIEYVVTIVDDTHATVKQTCKNEDGKTVKEEANLVITTTEDGDSTKYTVTINDINDGAKTLDITDEVNAYKKNKEKESELANIATEYAKYSKDSVNSSQKDSIQALIEKIESVETKYSSSLTDDEKNDLASKKKNLNDYLDKLSNVKTSIDAVLASHTDLTTSNVTSASKDSLTETKNTLDSLLNDDNLTQDERNSLTEKKTAIDSLVSKLAEVSDKIESIDNSMAGKTVDNVKSSDKSSFEDSITKTDELLDSTNLTNDERTSLTTKKAQMKAFVNKIDDTQKEYSDAKNSMNNIDSSDKSEENIQKLKEAIEKAEQLANSSNLTDAEKEELNTLIKQSQNTLKQMQSSMGNLWWLIITLSIIAVLEILAIVFMKLKEKKDKDNTFKTNAITLLPLVALASVAYQVGQIIACVLLSIIVIGSGVYLVYMFIKKNKNKNKQ